MGALSWKWTHWLHQRLKKCLNPTVPLCSIFIHPTFAPVWLSHRQPLSTRTSPLSDSKAAYSRWLFLHYLRRYSRLMSMICASSMPCLLSHPAYMVDSRKDLPQRRMPVTIFIIPLCRSEMSCSKYRVRSIIMLLSITVSCHTFWQCKFKALFPSCKINLSFPPYYHRGNYVTKLIFERRIFPALADNEGRQVNVLIDSPGKDLRPSINVPSRKLKYEVRKLSR